MAHATPSFATCQVGPLRQRLAQAPALPFSELLPQGLAEQIIRDENVSFRDRLFSPLLTLWVFLSQVLDPKVGHEKVAGTVFSCFPPPRWNARWLRVATSLRAAQGWHGENPGLPLPG